MTTQTPPSGPQGLSETGQALWEGVTAEYDLTAAEGIVLREACATADTITALEATLRDADLLVGGSKGQTVLHPAVAELRQQRGSLSRLLAQLQLPAEDGGTLLPSPLQVRGREAANKRWAAHG